MEFQDVLLYLSFWNSTQETSDIIAIQGKKKMQLYKLLLQEMKLRRKILQWWVWSSEESSGYFFLILDYKLN